MGSDLIYFPCKTVKLKITFTGLCTAGVMMPSEGPNLIWDYSGLITSSSGALYINNISDKAIWPNVYRANIGQVLPGQTPFEGSILENIVFDYKDLNLSVLKEQEEDKPKRKVFESAIANAAIHSSNMPGDKKYNTATYQYKRNIYRSPINYIIHGLIEGFTYIVPKKGIQYLLKKKK